MKEVNEIIEELKGLNSPLAGMPRSMPYTVPAGYFDQLPGDIWAMVNDQVVPAFARQSNPHEVPAGYFNDLPLKMLQAAKAQDIAQQKETAPAPVKRIAIYPQVRWAVAAVMALVISIGGYVMFFNGSDTGTEKILSSIPNNEINEYLINKFNVDEKEMVPSAEINNLKVENKDIVEYLNQTGWD